MSGNASLAGSPTASPSTWPSSPPRLTFSHAEGFSLSSASALRCLEELLGLRWQDVDLHASVLQVRQTCQWLPGQGFIFRQPKSRRSARSVALSRATVDTLRQHRVRQIEERLAAGFRTGRRG